MRNVMRRIAMAATMIGIAAAGIVIASPGAANAAESSADEIQATLGRSGITAACPIDQNVRWTKGPFGSFYVGYRYTVISATPTFFPSDGRAVDNLLSDPISGVFTSTVSRVVQVTVSAGSSVQLTEVMQANVSTSIMVSRTTAIGVNVTVTVPPRTRVTGFYGVDGYDVVYDAQQIVLIGGSCLYGSVVRFTTSAPTFVEGWRFTSTPL